MRVIPTVLLIVAGITGAAFRKRWAAFVVAGLSMIWTGASSTKSTAVLSLAVGAISTFFYLWLLYVAWQTIRDAKATSPAGVRRLFGSDWILFLVSWTIYRLAYLMPQISATADGVVIRNLIYSFAESRRGLR